MAPLCDLHGKLDMKELGILTLVALSQTFLVLTQTSIDRKDIQISECRIRGVFLVTLHGEYNLSLAQAHRTCLLFDTVLATKAQVDQAQQQGFETCRYGWVDDGFLVIPRISQKEQCGKNGTGLLIWKLDTDKQYDGYCFRQKDAQKTNTCEPLIDQTTTTIMNLAETSLMDVDTTSMNTVTSFSSEPNPVQDIETTPVPQETNSFLSPSIDATSCSTPSSEPFNTPMIEEDTKLFRNRIIYWALGAMSFVLLVGVVAAVVWYLRKSFTNDPNLEPLVTLPISCPVMGQHISNQTPAVFNKLPDRMMKHAALVRESGFLTYEEFLARVAEVNEITERLTAGQEKCLLFEVQPGSDSSALWKVIVRIVSSKINKTTGNIDASRILNLYQFTQLYREITIQASGVLTQSSICEGTAANGSSCQASIWLGKGFFDSSRDL
ncbi:RING finger protein 141 isoform X2 [Heterodontus francisci]|uniref:RING finger protein 141 isoform X2 n=1 Tax=Heterodontus francisci TaxID=7792 RepID=UPI00355BE1A4